MSELIENLADGAASADPAHATTKPARKPTKSKVEAAAATKSDLILKKLKLAKGATLQQLMEVTGWQQHSVRGFLSGTVRKKLGLELLSETGKDGMRRYRIADVLV